MLFWEIACSNRKYSFLGCRNKNRHIEEERQKERIRVSLLHFLFGTKSCRTCSYAIQDLPSGCWKKTCMTWSWSGKYFGGPLTSISVSVAVALTFWALDFFFDFDPIVDVLLVGWLFDVKSYGDCVFRDELSSQSDTIWSENENYDDLRERKQQLSTEFWNFETFLFVFNRTNRELTRWLDEIFHSQAIKNVPSTIGWLSNTQRRNWRVHGHDFCTYTTNQNKSQFLSSLTLHKRCILCVWIPYLLEIVETTLAPRWVEMLKTLRAALWKPSCRNLYFFMCAATVS